jgi:hypothetical protein
MAHMAIVDLLFVRPFRIERFLAGEQPLTTFDLRPMHLT